MTAEAPPNSTGELPDRGRRKRNDQSLLWTIVGAVAGVGSLIAALVIGDPAPQTPDAPATVAQAPRPDRCLVGAWMATPQWRPGTEFTMADGRIFRISAVTGQLRYYFGSDGQGSLEQVERFSGELGDGRDVWHNFIGKADFQYSTEIKGQIIYRGVQNSVSVYSQVEGEKVVKQPADATVANDSYTCGEEELVLTNAETAEYHLRRQ